MDFSKLQTPNPSMSKGKILKENALENSNKIVQLDLTLEKGLNGGPLFNKRGNVIGLMLEKSIAQKSFSYLRDAPENARFAIKSSYLRKIIPRPTNKKNQSKDILSNSDLNSGINVESIPKDVINNFVFLEIFN
jgi:S1-C subfamily serine protease